MLTELPSTLNRYRVLEISTSQRRACKSPPSLRCVFQSEAIQRFPCSQIQPIIHRSGRSKTRVVEIVSTEHFPISAGPDDRYVATLTCCKQLPVCSHRRRIVE